MAIATPLAVVNSCWPEPNSASSATITMKAACTEIRVIQTGLQRASEKGKAVGQRTATDDASVDTIGMGLVGA